MDNEFGRAKVESLKLDVSIEPKAHLAEIERAELLRDRVKPGEDLNVLVHWRPYRGEPVIGAYTFKVPEDLPDGTDPVTICSAQIHAVALRDEKPYLFVPEKMKDLLDAINLLASFPDDHVFMRLGLPTGGLTIGKDALPELPSFRRRILADARRSDVGSYHDAIVADAPAPFAVMGSRSFTVRVDRDAN